MRINERLLTGLLIIVAIILGVFVIPHATVYVDDSPPTISYSYSNGNYVISVSDDVRLCIDINQLSARAVGGNIDHTLTDLQIMLADYVIIEYYGSTDDWRNPPEGYENDGRPNLVYATDQGYHWYKVIIAGYNVSNMGLGIRDLRINFVEADYVKPSSAIVKIVAWDYAGNKAEKEIFDASKALREMRWELYVNNENVTYNVIRSLPVPAGTFELRIYVPSYIKEKITGWIVSIDGKRKEPTWSDEKKAYIVSWSWSGGKHTLSVDVDFSGDFYSVLHLTVVLEGLGGVSVSISDTYKKLIIIALLSFITVVVVFKFFKRRF